jgi:excisionase family DNA binding protein
MDRIWLTVDDISRSLKVHPQTVRRWLRTGELHGVLLGDKAGYRVDAQDLEIFLRHRGYSPQAERDSDDNR